MATISHCHSQTYNHFSLATAKRLIIHVYIPWYKNEKKKEKASKCKMGTIALYISRVVVIISENQKKIHTGKKNIWISFESSIFIIGIFCCCSSCTAIEFYIVEIRTNFLQFFSLPYIGRCICSRVQNVSVVYVCIIIETALSCAIMNRSWYVPEANELNCQILKIF